MIRRLLIALLLLLLLAAVAAWEVRHVWQQEIDRYKRYDPIIAEAAGLYGADPALIKAVIWQESRYDEHAFGAAEERGLMQVRVTAASEWATARKIQNFQPDDLFSPQTNIHAGTWYLAQAIRRWKNSDLPEAFGLAEYNAGRSNALRWAKDLQPFTADAFISRIDFPSTQRYVTQILKHYDSYRQGKGPETHLTYYQALVRHFGPYFNRIWGKNPPPPTT